MKIRLKHNLIKVHFNLRYRPDCLWLRNTPAHCQSRFVRIEEEGQTIRQGFLHMCVCWETRMKCVSDPTLVPRHILLQNQKEKKDFSMKKTKPIFNTTIFFAMQYLSTFPPPKYCKASILFYF